MQMFTKSGQFNPAAQGLKVGDELSLVVVGGGGAGGIAGYRNSFYWGAPRDPDLAGGVGGMGDSNYSYEGGLVGGGGAGAGYGAGGGGEGTAHAGLSSNPIQSGGGGASGEIIFGTVRLSSLAIIPVVVGLAGKRWESYDTGSTDEDDNPIWGYRQLPGTGGDSSFGKFLVAKGGSGGRSSGIADTPFQGHSPGGTPQAGISGGGGGGGGYIPGLPFWGGCGGQSGQNGGLLGGGGGEVRTITGKYESSQKWAFELTMPAGTSLFGGSGGVQGNSGASVCTGDGVVIVTW